MLAFKCLRSSTEDMKTKNSEINDTNIARNPIIISS